MLRLMKCGLMMTGVLFHSTCNSFTFIFKKSVPLPMGTIPLSIPERKPVHILTHTLWVRVQVDTGKDRVKNTHGLPMSNTKCHEYGGHSTAPHLLDIDTKKNTRENLKGGRR
jgi:hypothetical protein